MDDSGFVRVIGLMEAAERSIPSASDRFEALPNSAFRGACWMICAHATRSRAISPVVERVARSKPASWRRSLAARGHTELAETLGLNVQELVTRQQKLSGVSVVGIDDAGPDFLDRTRDDSQPDPFEMTAHRETLARLVAAFDDLPEKMQQVLSLYYCENLNLKRWARARRHRVARLPESMARPRAGCASRWVTGGFSSCLTLVFAVN